MFSAGLLGSARQTLKGLSRRGRLHLTFLAALSDNTIEQSFHALESLIKLLGVGNATNTPNVGPPRFRSLGDALSR